LLYGLCQIDVVPWWNQQVERVQGGVEEKAEEDEIPQAVRGVEEGKGWILLEKPRWVEGGKG
jgi:hypothetical protein